MLLKSCAFFDGETFRASGFALLIEGGKIAGFGPAVEFEGYAGPAYDLPGHTVLPGLIDCHAHLVLSGQLDPLGQIQNYSQAELTLNAFENAAACLQGGITALRDCGGVEYVEFTVRDACNSGRFFGPTVRAAGKFICMTGGTNCAVARQADGPDEIIKAVREQIHAGSDMIKLMATGGVLTKGSNVELAQLSAAEMQTGCCEAHRFGLPVASHAMSVAGVLNSVRAGVDSIEHGLYLDETCIEEMLEQETFLVPTLSAVANVADGGGKGVPTWAVEKAAQAAEAHAKSVNAYYRAGGKIAMGADTGVPLNPHGRNASELSHMVRIGMSAQDALTSATRLAAELMRLPDCGALRVGHAADILVVQGNPIENIEYASNVDNHRVVLKSGLPARDDIGLSHSANPTQRPTLGGMAQAFNANAPAA